MQNGIKHKSNTVCLKKTPLKEMCDFLTLKMLPLALAHSVFSANI